MLGQISVTPVMALCRDCRLYLLQDTVRLVKLSEKTDDPSVLLAELTPLPSCLPGIADLLLAVGI